MDDGFTTALLHDGGREGCGEGAGLLGGREVDSYVGQGCAAGKERGGRRLRCWVGG